ncbi:MAG TPA: hypothetical protein VMM55_04500 [Thermohalobaculum sp.]|nr:hypothetical protein [Thermohalobaculum sp.]
MTAKRDASGSGGGGRDERDRRLAERLRENLRRRKAQARARRHDETPGQAPDADGERD